MFTFDRKPPSPAPAPPAPKPASQRPAQPPLGDTLWFQVATSSNADAAASTEVTDERPRYLEPRFPPSTAAWPRLGRAAVVDAGLQGKALPPLVPGPPGGLARTRLSPPQVQRKPTVSSPEDAHEREADAVADDVVAMIDADTARPLPAGASGGSDDDDASAVQRARGDAAPGETPGLDVEAALRAAERGGEPLPRAVRSLFEPRFGDDFSTVRMHVDGEAAEAARSIHARAFTVGQHIVFGRGEFDPETSTGRRLIAHELTHVVQQRRAAGVPAAATAAPPEADATGAARRTASGQRTSRTGGAPAAIQRDGRVSSAAPGARRDPVPVRPSSGTDARLRAEGIRLLHQTLSPDEEAILPGVVCLIVRGGVVWYEPDGSAAETYAIRDGATLWETGWYQAGATWLLQLVEAGRGVRWEPTGFSGEQTRFLANWLTDADRGRFLQRFASAGNTVFLVALPPVAGGGGSDRQARTQRAERVVSEVRARLQASTPTTPRTTTPRRTIPDRLVVWSNERGVYVNVWVDGANEALALGDDETADGLQQRVEQATERVRRSRDPEESRRIADGATRTGFVGTPDPDRLTVAGSARIANVPAYPSRIRNAGPDITVTGATGHFTMEIDYAPAGADLVSQVTARMQPISYRWELIDVTNVRPDARAAAVTRRDGESPTSGVVRDFERDMEAIAEDTRADVSDTLSGSPVVVAATWPARAAWLSVVGISNAVRTVGSIISSFLSIATRPLDEESIGWDREGEFLVRCIATPDHDDDSVYIRASSVAVLPVKVQNINTRARLANDRDLAEIQRLERELQNATGPERARIEARLAALRRSRTATAGDLGGEALRSVRQAIVVAQELEAAERAGTPLEARTPAARLLAVQLELQRVPLAEYRQSLTVQEREISSRLSLISAVVARMPHGNYRPQVTLVSEETGQVNELVMVLGEADDSREGARHYLLADVTAPTPADRYVYEGRSTQAGIAGHSEAARQAFVGFRENNGYGRGSIAIRLPSTLDAAVGGRLAVDAEMRSAPGTRARVMQRLGDLATAAEVAGLFLTGPAALAVGAVAGVAGAVVAIDSLSRRHAAGALRWDFATVMDVVSIVGGATALGGAGAVALGNVRRFARHAARIQGSLHVFGLAQLGSQVLVIPIQLEQELREIENMPGTEGQKAARSAEALLRALRSGVVTFVSTAQMMDAARSMEAQQSAGDIDHGLAAPHEPAPALDGSAQRPADGATAPREGRPRPTPTAPELVRTPRARALEGVLGDLEGRVTIVENPSLQNTSTRVRYGAEGGVRIEVAQHAGEHQVRAHLPTARVLLRYEGPIGRLRQLLSRIVEVLTRIPGYGSQGFESRLEVRKLREIIDRLEQTRRGVDERLQRLGDMDEAAVLRQRDAIDAELATLEYQLRFHERLVDSLDPGSGYVAAYDSSTRASHPTLTSELTAIESALHATGDDSLTRVIDRVAELEREGRVAELDAWIREAAAQAGDRGQLNARVAELGRALQQAEGLAPGERIRLQAAGPGGARSFHTVVESRASGARIPGALELEMRRRLFTDAADRAAFDAYAARRFAESRSPATFDADFNRTPDAVVRRDVTQERARLAGNARLVRHAATLADPLNPQLSDVEPPGGRFGDIWVHFEQNPNPTVQSIDPVEIAQGQRLRAMTGEEIHVYGKDAMGRDFAGIDGTIGNPKRPMQLKRITGHDPASGARLKAQEALAAAQTAAISRVEVYIEVSGHSRADVRAAWNDAVVGRAPRSRGPVASGPVFSGDTIALIEISCPDGRMRVSYAGGIYDFHEL